MSLARDVPVCETRSVAFEQDSGRPIQHGDDVTKDCAWSDHSRDDCGKDSALQLLKLAHRL